jgi:hypothetical protein
MNFSSFLLAIQNRLAGVIVSGMFRRFEAQQALEIASIQADMEVRAKHYRDSGASFAASFLEDELDTGGWRGGSQGVSFVNELLSDHYIDDLSSKSTTDDDASLEDLLNGQPVRKPRGRKSLS